MELSDAWMLKTGYVKADSFSDSRYVVTTVSKHVHSHSMVFTRSVFWR